MPAENPAAPARLPHFDTVIRGYNPRQVNERVTRLTYDLRHAAKSRNEAVSKVAELTQSLGSVQHELAETRDRLARLSASPNSAEGMTERVRMIMHLAEEEIADYRAKADEYDRTTRDEADRYSYTVRAKADEHALVTRVDADTYATAIRTAADRYVADVRAEAERHLAANQERIADLDAEAAATRERLARETEAALNAQCVKREREWEQQAAAAQDEAARIVADAKRQAAVILDEAQWRSEASDQKISEQQARVERELAEANDRTRQAKEVQRRVAEQIDAALAVLGDARAQYAAPSNNRAQHQDHATSVPG